MFFIRADGNSRIGMGHIMRCLSIADALGKRGEKPVFLTASRESLPIITGRGFEAKLIGADKADAVMGDAVLEEGLLQEIPELAVLLEKCSAVVLVDSYRASREYLQQLGQYARVAYIDDLGQACPVDLLINYNIYGPRYRGIYEKEARKCLLGPAYMPLREEFLEKSDYMVAEEVKNVMITTGGTDPYLAAAAFTEAFLADAEIQKKNLQIHIVSGPFNKRVDELKKKFEDVENIFIYENVKSMRELMCRCDVVLTASGSTIYEVSSLGVPMLTFYFAENQRAGAEELENITGVINCGDFSRDAQGCLEKAVAGMRKLLLDSTYRREISRKERLLVDGQGADRIAKALIQWQETAQRQLACKRWGD